MNDDRFEEMVDQVKKTADLVAQIHFTLHHPIGDGGLVTDIQDLKGRVGELEKDKNYRRGMVAAISVAISGAVTLVVAWIRSKLLGETGIR